MEGRSFAHRRVHPDAATVHFDNLLGNGEAKTSTAFGLRIRVIDLMELFEDSRPLLLRDARASVHHTDREVSVDSFSGHADLTSISELDCIADEIEQHLRKPLLVAEDRKSTRLNSSHANISY